MSQLPHDHLWNESLKQLEMQMTQATFETWLKKTCAASGSSNGNLVINVKSAFAKDWLENSLFEMINRTVADVAGKPVQIEFVVIDPNDTKVNDDGPIGEEAAEAHRPEVSAPEPGSLDYPELLFVQGTNFHQVKTDMGRWLPELQYDSLFWNAYLGDQVWLFYRHLLMHWTKGLRKKDMPQLKMANEKNHWSSVFRLSYRKAVQWLGKSNQKIVPGGIYECHKSDAAHRVLKQDLDCCCQAHTVHNWQPKGEGGRCYYWRAGLLHRLYDEGLLAIEISGSGRARVQVWRNLPLLTPQQVGTMNSFLQDQHERWLEDNGRFYDLTVDQWLKFETPSLVPYLSYHKAGRQLTGRPPENPLLSKTSEGAS
jgi:hypothetical protein